MVYNYFIVLHIIIFELNFVLYILGIYIIKWIFMKRERKLFSKNLPNFQLYMYMRNINVYPFPIVFIIKIIIIIKHFRVNASMNPF